MLKFCLKRICTCYITSRNVQHRSHAQMLVFSQTQLRLLCRDVVCGSRPHAVTRALSSCVVAVVPLYPLVTVRVLLETPVTFINSLSTLIMTSFAPENVLSSVQLNQHQPQLLSHLKTSARCVIGIL